MKHWIGADAFDRGLGCGNGLGLALGFGHLHFLEKFSIGKVNHIENHLAMYKSSSNIQVSKSHSLLRLLGHVSQFQHVDVSISQLTYAPSR